ncbi:MAG: general secretion pathway protein GspB [Planctomycetes bacterium]|nr:general secretion pathway protein GspB [Planctomycetota bacterium]
MGSGRRFKQLATLLALAALVCGCVLLCLIMKAGYRTPLPVRRDAIAPAIRRLQSEITGLEQEFAALSVGQEQPLRLHDEIAMANALILQPGEEDVLPAVYSRLAVIAGVELVRSAELPPSQTLSDAAFSGLVSVRHLLEVRGSFDAIGTYVNLLEQGEADAFEGVRLVRIQSIDILAEAGGLALVTNSGERLGHKCSMEVAAFRRAKSLPHSLDRQPPAPERGGLPETPTLSELMQQRRYTYQPGGPDPMLLHLRLGTARRDQLASAADPGETDEPTARGGGSAAATQRDFESLHLRVEGISWSPTGSRAMINGRTVAEGETLVQERPEQDLVLSAIEEHAVVFTFQGSRYRVELELFGS